jgi:hypothetical protein
MIIKEYSIPLYRRIAKCKLKATEALRSDLYLESSYTNNLEVNKDNYKTEIYNITRNLNSLIIYSNTTNLKITNKYFNGIPLYQVIRNIPLDISTEIVELISSTITDQILIENKDGAVTIYLNTDLKTISKVNGIKVEDIITIGDSAINRISNVAIRKLKDRLKITINNLIDTDNYSIKVGSDYLFEPKIYKNWIEFYECVFPNLDQAYTHVYNHSFNVVNKTEYYNIKEYDTDNLKDPIYIVDPNIIETYYDKEVIVQYKSYRSNLLLPTNYSEEFFIYLNTSSNLADKTKNFYVSTIELNSGNLIPILTKRKQNVTYSAVENIFTNTVLRTCNSEGYTVLVNDFKDEKYNSNDDTRITTTRVSSDIVSIMKNKENYISSDSGFDIFQENDLNLIPTSSISGTMDPIVTNQSLLTDLVSQVDAYLLNQAAFTDKYKRYHKD